ncbi:MULTISPECIES: hypothetical protein [Prevotellaceae]|uniref:hypothetical protein n=1 Tax=Prevotellaceae TaxID=171552 RepID=UPI0003D2CFEA|nr:hypothetical protein [Prevotella phocaeensis]ETD21598.1 hypothetical protein HMPREF1199_00673 [Hoylesella oralis CC98A]
MKSFIFAVLLIFLPLAGRAQIFGGDNTDYIKNGPGPFIKGGVVLSDYIGRYSEGTKSKVGYSTELGVEFPFRNKLYGFQPALRVIKKGAKVPWKENEEADTYVP